MEGNLWTRLACLVCLVMPLAYAEPAPTEVDLYQEALQLIEKGDKQGAIERYNHLLESIPNHAGAWMDLALLYCEQGDVRRAHSIFEQIETRFDLPPAIREVIRHYRSKGCVVTAEPSARWSVNLSGGYTDNVNHGLSNPLIDLTLPLGVLSVRLNDTFLPRASSVGAVGINYVRNLETLPGTLFFAGVTEKRFPSVREFNQRSALAEVAHRRTVGGWLHEYDLVASHLSLNQQTHQVGLLTQGAWWLPTSGEESPRFGVELAASRWRYPHDHIYDSTMIEGRVNIKWMPTQQLALRGAAGPMIDNAEQQRPGLDRRGYLLSLAGQWTVSDRVRLDANFRQRVLHDEAVYSPLFGATKRRSTQQQFTVGVQARTDPASPAAWRLEWEHARSRDNIPLFPYSNHTVTLSWHYHWDTY